MLNLKCKNVISRMVNINLSPLVAFSALALAFRCQVVYAPHFEARPGPNPTYTFEDRFRPESQMYRVSQI